MNQLLKDLSKRTTLPKIGLDLDDVLSDFSDWYAEYYDLPKNPIFWKDTTFKKFNECIKDKDFWITMPPKQLAMNLCFEPHCIITSRHCAKTWTEQWLDENEYGGIPLYNIGVKGAMASKKQALKESGCDWFVDDRIEYYMEARSLGITTFLMDASHNLNYNVGNMRLNELNDLRPYLELLTD